eukprot:s2417_g9.t1
MAQVYKAPIKRHRRSKSAAPNSPSIANVYDLQLRFGEKLWGDMQIHSQKPKLLPEDCANRTACLPYLEALLAYPIMIQAAPCLEDSRWPITQEEVHDNSIRWLLWLWARGADSPPPYWRGQSGTLRVRHPLQYEAAGAFAGKRRSVPGDSTGATSLLKSVAKSWDPSGSQKFDDLSLRQQHFESIFGDMGRPWQTKTRGPMTIQTKVHPDDFKGPRSSLRFFIYDLPPAAHAEALVQLHGRIREAAQHPATCNFGMSPCVEMRGEGGAFTGYRPYAAEVTFLSKLLSAPDEVIVEDPRQASYFIVPFLSSTWCFISAPKTWAISARNGCVLTLETSRATSRHRFPRPVSRVLETMETMTTYRKAREPPKPVLSAFLAGCQLRLTRKAGGSTARTARTARSAVAEVRTEPVRPDFWDGAGMVLFVKGTEKTVPSLGRIGSFLDKQCFDGALAKLVADTSFDASLGSVRVHHASDKGIQNVILVGAKWHWFASMEFRWSRWSWAFFKVCLERDQRQLSCWVPFPPVVVPRLNER